MIHGGLHLNDEHQLAQGRLNLSLIRKHNEEVEMEKASEIQYCVGLSYFTH